MKSALSNTETDVNVVHNQYAALMYAAHSGRKDIIQLLLANGADPHIDTWKNRTALREAVKGGHKDIIKLLLDTNSKFRKRSMGYALVEAAQKGYKDIVKLLFAKGADLNAETSSMGTTALIEASGQGHTDIVKLLLAKGADPHHQHVWGGTALTIAKEQGHKEIVQLLNKIDKSSDGGF